RRIATLIRGTAPDNERFREKLQDELEQQHEGEGEGEYEDSPEAAQHQEMLDKLEEYDARYASQKAAAASDQAPVDAANAPKQSSAQRGRGGCQPSKRSRVSAASSVTITESISAARMKPSLAIAANPVTSGCQKRELHSATGLSSVPSWRPVHTSKTSTRLPTPPGRATQPSARPVLTC